MCARGRAVCCAAPMLTFASVMTMTLPSHVEGRTANRRAERILVALLSPTVQKSAPVLATSTRQRALHRQHTLIGSTTRRKAECQLQWTRLCLTHHGGGASQKISKRMVLKTAANSRTFQQATEAHAALNASARAIRLILLSRPRRHFR